MEEGLVPMQQVAILISWPKEQGVAEFFQKFVITGDIKIT